MHPSGYSTLDVYLCGINGTSAACHYTVRINLWKGDRKGRSFQPGAQQPAFVL